MQWIVQAGLVLMLFVSGSAQAAPVLVLVPVLVEGVWLEQQLAKESVVLVDMSDDDTQYTRFHLPGAVRLDYSSLLKPAPRGKPKPRLSDGELIKLLGQLGIRRDSHVVVYDDMGGLHAGRLFLELERLGHPQVSVLNGGLVQWILDGRKVDNRPVARKPVAYNAPTERRDNLAVLDDVLQAATRGTTLLDVRTLEEYVGDPKQPRSGHVPGARFWPWEQAVRMDDGFVLRDAQALRASLAAVGVRETTQPVVLYCQSGHRASQTYLTLRHLGFENVRLHAGSMLEYSQDPNAPLTRGNAP